MKKINKMAYYALKGMLAENANNMVKKILKNFT